MRLFNLAVLLFSITACAAGLRPEASPPEPSTSPSNTPSVTVNRSSSTWTFHTDQEPHRYQLTNTTIFRLQLDSAQSEQKGTISIAFSLTTDSNNPSTRISGEISQFSFQTGSRTTQEGSSAEIVSIPFTASRSEHLLEIQVQEPKSTAVPCTDTGATLVTHLLSQLNTIPKTIQKDARWRDSLTVSGCQGTVPLEAQIIYNYHVIGETQISNHQAILIQRTDSTHASGEGNEGQHRLAIETTATGQTQLFLNPRTGTLLNSTSRRLAIVLTRSSGREIRFSQQSTETVQSIP